MDQWVNEKEFNEWLNKYRSDWNCYWRKKMTHNSAIKYKIQIKTKWNKTVLHCSVIKMSTTKSKE